VYSLTRVVPGPRTDAIPTVAAFDVDGTLTTRDCVTPFLRRTAGARLLLTLARHPFALARALVRRDRDELKELACAALNGVEAQELDRQGAAFAETIRSRWLRTDTAARLRRHRELGHRVVLASASLEAYLAPLAALLEVDGLVCTRLETGPDGRLTGRLQGANCRGQEKARRVQAWLEANGIENAELWAYGDSRSDAELLAMADNAVWVGSMPLDADPPSRVV
jgi:phosphatidylglycerophosphatase C